MKVLCVAEKPSIAKSITEILSGGRWDTRDSGHKYVRNYDFSYNLPAPLGDRGFSDFTVTAVLGHLTSTDFGDDHRQWSSCDPFALFDANILTFINSSLKPIERNLQREARQADILMIWTDCDREGEHIGSEIVDVCRKVNRGIIVKRARFSAIIPAQIHQACRQAGELDMQQADAVSARMALDLRIGAAFTRLTTMTLQTRAPELQSSVISYGPCQFPTLGFVVDQYNRVQAFVPESFWYIYMAIERAPEDGRSRDVETVEFKWRRNHLFDMEAVVALYEQCVDEPMATVTSVETKPTTKWKPLPLTTVELQQSGSRLLHMTPKKILDIAEKLYQRGILSYPRTETDQYDKAFDFKGLIQKQTYSNEWGDFSQQLLDGGFQTPRNGRKNDKAHPPIHPTANANDLPGDEKRVFELVTRRFLASCSTNAEGKTTTVEAEIAGEQFSTSGLVVIARNYLEVYPYDKWASSSVPDFQENEQFMPSVLEVKDGKTTRPNLLTEADLVGLMDRNGIGTDATIAEHIAKIIEREYVTEKQEQRIKYLVPSSLGVGLVEGYNAIGFDRSLSKPHLRAETEHRMQRICDGLQTKRDVLNFTIDQYKEVYIKAKREFETVVNSVLEYLHGRGEAQEALRAASRGRGRGGARGTGTRGAAGTRGARGGRGGAAAPATRAPPRNDDNDNEGDDDDDSDGGPPRGGARGRARGATRGRGASTSTRGRGGAGGTDGPARKKRKQDDDEESRTCTCGSEAVLRTAGAASRNAGRSFYTCPKPPGQQCGFFEWADEESGGRGAGSAGPSRARVPPTRVEPEVDRPAQRPRMTAPRDADDEGTMRCECGLEAKNGVASKDGPNKGRKFWTCPNSKRAQCGFFQWDDDADDNDEDGPAAGPSRPRAAGGGTFSGPTTGECFKCGQTGHWSNACPDADGGVGGNRADSRGRGRTAAPGGGTGGGGGGGSGECFKCGHSGHWANACPDDAGGGNTSRSRTAPRGGRTSANGAVGGGSGECFKCGQSGHWANACPNEDGGGGRGGGTRGRTTSSRGGRGRGGRASAGGGGAGGGTSGECFKCNRPGHRANACPDDTSGGSRGRNR